jgi:excinuclease UvrABC nuclease subunit
VLAQRLEFSIGDDASFFNAVPAAPAIFSLRGDNAASEPYISKTANLRRRLQRLLGQPTEQSKRLNLRDRIGWAEFTPTGSDFESGFLLYQLLRVTFPGVYAARLRFRFAPLIKLHLENEYPRASITTRLGRLTGKSVYYGPFPSRVLAEKFANDSLDFFRMRRCVEDLHPDPSFPGCVYSEMKMCLAPCFKGCSDGEYKAEVDRVREYFDSAGDTLVREISSQRDSASASLEFEKASTSHARLEKLKPLLSQLPELVQRIDRLKAVILQRSATAGTVNFFRVDAGAITGPVPFRIQPEEHTRPESIESRVASILNLFENPGEKSALETMEHLAMLRRWYFRSSRKGEIFVADGSGDLPVRRIVRGISRVYRNELPEVENAQKLDG